MTAANRVYREGEIILKQGERSDTMFVIQCGIVEVVHEDGGPELCIAELGQGELIGEMALFQPSILTATVHALSEVRLLTVDRSVALRRLHEDPSLAFPVMSRMASRITELSKELAGQTRARLNDALCHLEIAKAGKQRENRDEPVPEPRHSSY